MISCAHYDDRKEKWQSHEVFVDTDEESCIYIGGNALPYDLSDIIGYGATKEEAFEEFKENFNTVFEQWKEFAEKINSSDIEIKESECVY